jgi:hypothetical protein
MHVLLAGSSLSRKLKRPPNYSIVERPIAQVLLLSVTLVSHPPTSFSEAALVAKNNATFRLSRLMLFFLQMWSKLYLRRTITLVKHLDVPPYRVLDILHDPPSLIMRSPVVVSFKELPSYQPTESIHVNPSPELKYTITDLVPILFGLFHISATVTATFTLASDGSSMYVEAVAGTKLKTMWCVKEDLIGLQVGGEPTRGSLLTEVVEITVSNLFLQFYIHIHQLVIVTMQGFFLLVPFIMRTMKQSQKQGMQALTARIRQRR